MRTITNMRTEGIIALLILSVLVGVSIGYAILNNVNTVQTNDILEIYYFYSKSCLACKIAKPYIQKIKEKIGIKYCSVENLTEDCLKLLKEYEIKYIPTAIVYYRNGDVKVFVGVDEIKQLYNSLK